MDGIYLVLIGLALFGLLPLIVILIRKRKAEEILAHGITTQATVSFIQTAVRNTGEIVHYQFQDVTREWYRGKLTTGLGVYKVGDVIEVYYLKDKPKRNTVKGAWGSKFIIIFGVVIALAVWFMVYKLYEMVRDGQI